MQFKSNKKAHRGTGSWPFFDRSATFPPQVDPVDLFSSVADGGEGTGPVGGAPHNQPNSNI